MGAGLRGMIEPVYLPRDWRLLLKEASSMVLVSTLNKDYLFLTPDCSIDYILVPAGAMILALVCYYTCTSL